MKTYNIRTIIVSIIAALAMLSSCKNEDLAPTPNVHYLSVAVPPANNLTKAELTPNDGSLGIKVAWKVGDALAISDAAGDTYIATYTIDSEVDISDDGSARFSGTVALDPDKQYTYCYPANAAQSKDEIIEASSHQSDGTTNQISISNDLSHLTSVMYSEEAAKTSEIITLKHLFAYMRATVVFNEAASEPAIRLKYNNYVYLIKGMEAGKTSYTVDFPIMPSNLNESTPATLERAADGSTFAKYTSKASNGKFEAGKHYDFNKPVDNSEIIKFEDVAFKEALINPNFPGNFSEEQRALYMIDSNDDGEISMNEAAEATRIYASAPREKKGTIKTMPELQFFTNLEVLDCSNNLLVGLDLSYNTKLTKLDCGDNSLTSLNLSKNTKLTELLCYKNSLTSLDLRENTELIRLSCGENLLETLNVNMLSKLTNLYCHENKLTNLDVRNNTKLTNLGCSANYIEAIDVRMLTNLGEENLSCGNQKDDKTIVVTMTLEQRVLPTLNLWHSYERINILIDGKVDNSQIIQFQDPAFKNALLENKYIDMNGDSNISIFEASLVRVIDVAGELGNRGTISNMSEIQHFTKLEELYCAYNAITSLDLSMNTELIHLDCGINNLETINISKNTMLEYFSCVENSIKNLDVSKNTELTLLECSWNSLESLDVSKNTKLETLLCYYNSLTTLDVSMLTNLRKQGLSCGDQRVNKTIVTTMTAAQRDLPVLSTYSNERVSIWVLGEGSDEIIEFEDAAFKEALINPNFPGNFSEEQKALYMIDSNDDGEISMNEAAEATRIYASAPRGKKGTIKTMPELQFFTNLEVLDCSNNPLVGLDLSYNTKLTKLDCGENSLTSLNLSKNTKLTELLCYRNFLTSLDLKENSALTELSCGENLLETLNVNMLSNLTELYCHENKLTNLNVSNNTKLANLGCSANYIEALDVSLLTNLGEEDLSCGNQKDDKTIVVTMTLEQRVLPILDLWHDYERINILIDGKADNSQIIQFQDTAFKNALLENKYIDMNGDGNISIFEASLVRVINVAGELGSRGTISNMAEIQHFTKLEELYCAYNAITSLDLSMNTELIHLDCGINNLETINISKNTMLEYFSCVENSIKNLDVSKNTELTLLECSWNSLESLDVSKNTKLETLLCYYNSLTTLDVSMLTNLRKQGLSCGDQRVNKTIVTTMTAAQRDLSILSPFNNNGISINIK